MSHVDVETVGLLPLACDDGATRATDSDDSPERRGCTEAFCRRKSRKTRKTLCIGLAALSFIAILAVVVPIKKWLLTLSDWTNEHHAEGSVLMPVLFCVAIPVAIPSTMLEILAGSVFGILHGSALNIIGKTCGSVTAFILGKRLGKERIGSYLHTKFPSFVALSKVLQGPNWRPLILLQLSSLPPIVKCYGLSVTDVSLLRFAVTSLIGGAPNAILWAYIGQQTRDLMKAKSTPAATPEDVKRGGSQWVMFVVGLLCTMLAMVFMVVYTRRELNAQLVGNMHKEIDQSDDEVLSTTDEEDACVVVAQIVPVAASDHLYIAKRTSLG